ncbi:MAG: hypothetical protein LIO56_07970 [Lachnospiraceae bacterium]|nr:hypothetical protein [Lachnospiraceae bacterium]
MAKMIWEADARKENINYYRINAAAEEKKQNPIIIIGEAVTSASLAAAIEMECGRKARVLCPLVSDAELLRPGDTKAREEDDLIREIKTADVVIADPLYRALCTGKEFYSLPHTAFSGRIYEKAMPNLIARKLGADKAKQATGKGTIC